MIAVDTNILVRYVIKDDAEQFAYAEAFLGERDVDDPAFVSLLVLAELVWVLRRVYRLPAERVQDALMLMVETAGILFEDEYFVSQIVRSGVALKDEVADHLIAHSAQRAGCVSTVTFDKRAAKAIPSMELLA